MQVQVDLLMTNHVLLADVLCITQDAPDTFAVNPPPDLVWLEALCARLKLLPKATVQPH